MTAGRGNILAWAAAGTGIVAILAIASLAVYGLLSYNPNPGVRTGWVGVSNKTLWQWLELVIIPIVLGAGAYLFTRAENRNAQDIAERRAQDEQDIARRRAQDEALQTYLDGMESLMLDRNLREAPADSEVRTLARSRTLTVLPRLDGERKGSIVQFLYESRLINRENSLISLAEADLEGVHLSGANLKRANLEKAHLSGANLKRANLLDAHLKGAYLIDAHLEKAVLAAVYMPHAHLEGADLTWAYLERANLDAAHLTGANLKEAYLPHAHLKGTHLEGTHLTGANLGLAYLDWAHLEGATLEGAHLERANLEGTHLERANLEGAHLPGANLEQASLDGANLTRANLTKATGLTYERLTSAKSLVGATMPNGQKYEDWIKEQDAGQDEDIGNPQ